MSSAALRKHILCLSLLCAAFSTTQYSTAQAPAAEAGLVRTAATGQLLQNESFAEWEGNVPKFWIVSDPASVSKAAEADTGKSVLSLMPADKDYVDVRQDPDLRPLLPGDTIILEVECYADKPGSVEATLRLSYAGDKRIIMRDTHPGGGWVTLRTVCQVPEEPVSLLECRIRALKGADTPVRVRSASAEIVPAIP